MPPARKGRPATLGRLLAIGVLIGILVAYVGPVREYLSAREELRRHQVQLTAAQQERDRIGARLRALREPAVLEARARELGMVRPGEKPFVVKGLPPAGARPAPAPPAGDGGGVLGWLRDLL
ncbi:MAG: septum formation initiator family protein [Thermoleophilia bacterium]|nr:septum formation initiator family protein [Thermoleophilia bacterium]